MKLFVLCLQSKADFCPANCKSAELSYETWVRVLFCVDEFSIHHIFAIISSKRRLMVSDAVSCFNQIISHILVTCFWHGCIVSFIASWLMTVSVDAGILGKSICWMKSMYIANFRQNAGGKNRTDTRNGLQHSKGIRTKSFQSFLNRFIYGFDLTLIDFDAIEWGCNRNSKRFK